MGLGKKSKFFNFGGGGILQKSNLDLGKTSKFFNWGGISEKSNLDLGKKSKFFNLGGGYFRIFSIYQNKRFWRI